MESTSPEDGIISPDAGFTVPLLLNPTYARSKSSVFDELRKFRMSLRWCALDHSSTTGKTISYLAFILFTIVIPAVTSLSFSTAAFGSVTFNQLVQIPESSLAAIAFFTLAAFFRRHGLRQLLLVDSLRNDPECVRHSYTRELDHAFRCLTYILLPAFSLELAHKILFFATEPVRFPQMRPLIMAATLAAWVYRTGVFLLVCVLFRLTCELQILRFEGFHKMFEGERDVYVIFKEHVRIKKQPHLTSRRYRGFIIGCLVTITVSQLGALMLILGSRTPKNFCNSGDMVVCSVVQLSGFLLCLFGAARITHRAQSVVSIASCWHMNLCFSPVTKSEALGQEKQGQTANQPYASYSSAHDTSEVHLLTSSREASTVESRQALVTYLQHNGGGITLLGFTLDRGLLHTLFAFEMTLVLWILGKVIVVVS